MTAATVIGDIFFDHVCDLGATAQALGSLDDGDIDVTADVSDAVGGNAVQFAVAAIGEGFAPVRVIGKVGAGRGALPDFGGAIACSALAQAGAEPVLAHDEKTGTGRSMLVYLPGDRRLMVSDPGANATFGPEDIDARMWRALGAGGLLHVSGYALVRPSRREATSRLMGAARDAGATVAIDVVPHDITRFVPAETILSSLREADWLLIAASTARRLLGAGPGAAADELLAGLRPLADSLAIFHHPADATVLHAGRRTRHHFDYVPGAGSRGQSARSQARLLARHLLSHG